jgi:hypothetical protein
MVSLSNHEAGRCTASDAQFAHCISLSIEMAGLDPATPARLASCRTLGWVPGASPGMTAEGLAAR